MKSLGIVELVIGIGSIGASYWSFYKMLCENHYWMIIFVLIFLGYGILAVVAGIHNLSSCKEKKK